MTRWSHGITGLAVALILIAGPAFAAPLSKEDRAGIEKVTKEFAEAFRSGNRARLAALYTQDAVLLPPDGPAVEGAEAIAAFMETFPPVTAFSLENVEVEGMGDLAYVRGIFSMTVPPAGEGAPPVTSRGKYIDIRKRQADGRWLIYRDMFSFDAPHEE